MWIFESGKSWKFNIRKCEMLKWEMEICEGEEMGKCWNLKMWMWQSENIKFRKHLKWQNMKIRKRINVNM